MPLRSILHLLTSTAVSLAAGVGVPASPAFSTPPLGVTAHFDFDRDEVVDGSDLAFLANSNGVANLPSFAANFGSHVGSHPPVLTPKVMVVTFDPVLETHAGLPLTEHMRWNEVDALVWDFIANIRSASSNHVNYVVVENLTVDDIPVKADGFRYTDESYLACANRQEPCHDPDGVDYGKILGDYDVCNRLNRGDIDELWLFGGPWFGFYESRLAGPEAFWYNAPPLQGTGCERLLPIMGFNYERGVAEMLHSFGHRAESSITKVFNGWDVTQSRHAWDRFGHNAGQTSGVDFYQCGSVHFPPNGLADYDYANPGIVASNCDEWYDYPDFSGSPEWIDCSEWNCDHGSYMRWWFAHLPKTEGLHGGKLSNWWAYIVGNRYDEVYPRIMAVSSEYAPGWAEYVLDGGYGTCNLAEWATADQPTGWVQIQVKNSVRAVSIYDRACPERVTSGHLELDNGSEFFFGPLDNDGDVPAVIEIDTSDVEWVKVFIDASEGGPNPGIAEIAFEYGE